MDKSLAISVQEVTKVYKLYDRPIDRLKESMSLTHKSYHKDFFALDKLSFDVKKGETVGIIGTNGSGKSTILKIITGVLSPTTGTVEVDGNISALLELGAGFNSDYTGIENIYMNGTMMGFTREQMDAKMQDILDFADIGDFVNQPVKTYSSGMFVRLAFALAINVEPEILIVDEALSVGDVFFQAKCYRRMEEMMKNGTTILMVSHDMGSIIKYCQKVVLLNRGKFVAQGPAGKMVDLYKKILANQMDDLDAALAAEQERLTGGPGIAEAGKDGAAGHPGSAGADAGNAGHHRRRGPGRDPGGPPDEEPHDPEPPGAGVRRRQGGVPGPRDHRPQRKRDEPPSEGGDVHDPGDHPLPRASGNAHLHLHHPGPEGYGPQRHQHHVRGLRRPAGTAGRHLPGGIQAEDDAAGRRVPSFHELHRL